MSATLKTEVSKPAEIWLALELANTVWKVALLAAGLARPSVHEIDANDFDRLQELIAAFVKRLGLTDPLVVIGYEAGRHGHYISRQLERLGFIALQVDSSSIERPKRKFAKSDRIDAQALVRLLRDHREERRHASIVHVPSPQDEADRTLHRERDFWKNTKTRMTNRFQAILVRMGVIAKITIKRSLQVKSINDLNGEPLPPSVQAELQRLLDGIEHARNNIRALEAEQQRQLTGWRKQPDGVQPRKLALIEQLMAVETIGPQTAWVLVQELFGWRQFRNRRQLGACVGLCATPYDSGDSKREQGISRTGNARVRALLIELAWRWVRKQDQSAITLWFKARFDHGTRSRKVGIVAVARRLAIALWRYLNTGELDVGARLKATTV